MGNPAGDSVRRAPIHVYAVPEQLVVGTRAAVKEKLIELVEAGHDVVLDLSRTQYIDSSGLGALLSASRHGQVHHRRIVLAGITEDVRILFELTRVGEMFTFASDVEDARTLLAGG